ncbi:MAG: DNA replication/repair protein RecF [Bdellovibrionales bacterium]
MHFSRLRLKNFRNYQDLELQFNPGVNIFVGQNGQGKTNLVEALHLLVKGDSFRAGLPEVWLRKVEEGHADFATLQASVHKAGLSNELEMRYHGGKRQFFVDQKKVISNILPERYPAVLFSPESLAAIKEGPDQRRQLIDDALMSHGEGARVTDFKRALRSRNRLLRDFKAGIYQETQILELLEAFDQVYLPLAAKLASERIRRLNELEPLIRDAVRSIAPEDLGDISVDYEISDRSAREYDLHEILQTMRNRLKLLRKSELSYGASLVGPHKHEVHFLSAGNDARYFCSQGQQRALILGFKMAQIMYHYSTFQVHPLLLLDDVLSELDPHKGANLLKFLEGIRSQILLTTTDISFPFEFGNKGMSVYRMKSGAVEELRP